jgi:dinuclear metal center YbgI/SA1388 family protein
MVALAKIIDWCDRTLRTREIGDYENALNGLQLENAGTVTKIAAAVDFSTRALEAAADCGANLLIVHHGMFWSGLRPITATLYEQLKLALEKDIAIYGAHLPLDLHPELGNNVLLMRTLGIENSEAFFEEKGSLLGRRAAVEISLEEIVQRLGAAVGGRVHCTRAGPQTCRQIGVITGGAGGEIARVAAEGIDTFITGEAPHGAAVAAHELRLNLLLGGHYATETFGVKALAAGVANEFQLGWEFVDLPTQL